MKNYRFGDKDRKFSSIVDKGINIDLDQEKRNSEILYEEFPEDAALAGLIHDLTIQLEASEPNWFDLPEQPEFNDIMINALSGKDSLGTDTGRNQVKQRIDELNKEYGINPSKLLEEEFFGTKITEAINSISDYRSDFWREDWSNLRRTGLPIEGKPIETEKYLKDDDVNIAGKADLLAHRLSGDEIREIKIRSSDKVVKPEDEYQVAVYSMLEEDADKVTLEYPLQSLQIEEDEFSKSLDEWYEMIKEDKDSLRSVVDRFLDFQERKLGYDLSRSSDLSRRESEGIRNYRDRIVENGVLDEDKVEHITENATKQAVETLEDELESINILLNDLSNDYKALPDVYDSWRSRTRKETNHPLWDNLTDLYEAGVIEKEEKEGNMYVRLSEEFDGASEERVIDEINQLSDDYVIDDVYSVDRTYNEDIDFELIEDHFKRSEWDTKIKDNHFTAVKSSWKGDKEFIVDVEKDDENIDFKANAVYKSRSKKEDPRSFFEPRHHKNYLETSIVDRMNTIVQRQKILDEAADEVVESLEGDKPYLEQVKSHLNYLGKDGESLDGLIDEVVEGYYHPGSLENGLKASKLLMPYSEEVESRFENDKMEEGLLPYGETVGETKKALDMGEKGSTYLRSYLERITEKAREKDQVKSLTNV